MKNFTKYYAKNALALALGMVIVSVPYITQAADVPVVDSKANEKLGKIQENAKNSWDELKKIREMLTLGKGKGKLEKLELNAEKVGKHDYNPLTSDSKTAADIKKFLGEDSHCVKPKTTGDDEASLQKNPLVLLNYNACAYERAMKVVTLNEMIKIFEHMDKRSEKIAELMGAFEDDGEMTPGKLQAFQFQMAYYQAQTQQDIVRLQLSLDIHKQRVEIYKQQQIDTASAMMRGNNKAVGFDGLLGALGIGSVLK